MIGKNLPVIVMLLIITFVTSCSHIDIATNQNVSLSFKKLEKIAILPFDIKGAQWGDEFADAMGHYFLKKGKIEVVERQAISKLLKEQNLSLTGLIDNAKAQQIGKLLGADAIVIGKGSILQQDRNRRDVSHRNLLDTCIIKVLNVENGRILATVRKAPGIPWDVGGRAKYCLSLTLIWDRNDILIENSEYDSVAMRIVEVLMDEINKIESKNKKK